MKSTFLLSLLLSALALSSCGHHPDAAADPNLLLSTSFENLANWLTELQSATLTHERAHSGTTSLKVDAAHEFSLTYNNALARLHPTTPRKLKVAAWVWLPNAQAAATLVTTLADPATPGAKPQFWDGLNLNETVKTYGQWMPVSKVITLPANASPAHRLSLYLWRTAGNQPVYLDDLTVSIVE